MKIAFVDKGGSGKSTISGLFVRHLVDTNQKILAIDADINQYFASMLGTEFDPSKALSLDSNERTIRTHLIGNNSRIASAKKMIKTTPPGSGSNLVTILNDNETNRQFGTSFAPKTCY